MEIPDKELIILENIYSNNHQINQRSIARNANISLGMVNAILKRFFNKGWISIKKINNRTIHYAITPSGIKEIFRRSSSYFKRTIKNIASYKEKIEFLIIDVKTKKYDGIVLLGMSDLEFILEYLCHKHALSFSTRDEQKNDNLFYLISEEYIAFDEKAPKKANAFLSEIILR
jgi:predicted transcriptional regulator